MYEQEIIKCLKNLGKQIWSMQQIMSNLDRDVRNMRVSGNTIVKNHTLWSQGYFQCPAGGCIHKGAEHGTADCSG